ncbi:unnamed protein product [Durusdinium trenchii]|uniref:Uncharacterized protein n=1 Tax=Durusdinium trenchii TaxID=1381693 RepID=A0ABP0PCG3_9DINO
MCVFQPCFIHQESNQEYPCLWHGGTETHLHRNPSQPQKVWEQHTLLHPSQPKKEHCLQLPCNTLLRLGILPRIGSSTQHTPRLVSEYTPHILLFCVSLPQLRAFRRQAEQMSQELQELKIDRRYPIKVLPVATLADTQRMEDLEELLKEVKDLAEIVFHKSSAEVEEPAWTMFNPNGDCGTMGRGQKHETLCTVQALFKVGYKGAHPLDPLLPACRMLESEGSARQNMPCKTWRPHSRH